MLNRLDAPAGQHYAGLERPIKLAAVCPAANECRFLLRLP
jgi:hypothetical protein